MISSYSINQSHLLQGSYNVLQFLTTARDVREALERLLTIFDLTTDKKKSYNGVVRNFLPSFPSNRGNYSNLTILQFLQGIFHI